MVVVLLVDRVEELDQVLQPLVVGVVHVEAAVAAAHAVVEGEPECISRLCLLENYADLEKNIFLGTLKFWEYRFGGKKCVNSE